MLFDRTRLVNDKFLMRLDACNYQAGSAVSTIKHQSNGFVCTWLQTAYDCSID